MIRPTDLDDGDGKPLRAIICVDPVTVESRLRRLLMRVTAPLEGSRLPVVVLSHGVALCRSDYRPLVEHLARAGYIVIQPDHPDASRDGFAQRQSPPDTWRIRFEDLAWIGRHLPTVLKPITGLVERADLSRTAVLGHSFGGHSAALCLRARIADGPDLSPTPFQAGVLLAPPGNQAGMSTAWKSRSPHLKVDWSGLRGPVLMIVGTRDTGPMSDLGPSWHEDGFRLAPRRKGIFLLRMEGCGHYLGGIDTVLRSPQEDATPERRSQVLEAVSTFLDHALDHSGGAARRWQALRATLAQK